MDRDIRGGAEFSLDALNCDTEPVTRRLHPIMLYRARARSLLAGELPFRCDRSLARSLTK